MLCAGLVGSVCHLLLLLSGDYALCGSCWQCVMYYCCCLATMLLCRYCCCLATLLCAGLVWQPCFVSIVAVKLIIYIYSIVSLQRQIEKIRLKRNRQKALKRIKIKASHQNESLRNHDDKSSGLSPKQLQILKIDMKEVEAMHLRSKSCKESCQVEKSC